MQTRSPTLDLWNHRLLSFNLPLSSFSTPFLHLSIYHSQGWPGRKSINPSVPSLTSPDRWGGEGGCGVGGEGGGVRVGDLRLLFIIFLQHCVAGLVLCVCVGWGAWGASELMYADSLRYISQFWDLQQVWRWGCSCVCVCVGEWGRV